MNSVLLRLLSVCMSESQTVCGLSAKRKERNWKLWRFVATSGCLVELPLRFLHRKSADRALWTHSSFVEAEARPWVRRAGHLLCPRGTAVFSLPWPCGHRHEAANTRHRRVLPSCNHWWHTRTSFPDRFSCPSSCEWGKQHRKNNTSCRLAQGMWPLQTQHK